MRKKVKIKSVYNSPSPTDTRFTALFLSLFLGFIPNSSSQDLQREIQFALFKEKLRCERKGEKGERRNNMRRACKHRPVQISRFVVKHRALGRFYGAARLCRCLAHGAWILYAITRITNRMEERSDREAWPWLHPSAATS